MRGASSPPFMSPVQLWARDSKRQETARVSTQGASRAEARRGWRRRRGAEAVAWWRGGGGRQVTVGGGRLAEVSGRRRRCTVVLLLVARTERGGQEGRRTLYKRKAYGCVYGCILRL